MVQINWTVQAKDDLKDIADYISKDSVFYAKRTVFKIQKRTQILKLNVYAGKIVHEFPVQNYRELIEGNFRIVYCVVSDSRIDIITVHHSARDLTNRNL